MTRTLKNPPDSSPTHLWEAMRSLLGVRVMSRVGGPELKRAAGGDVEALLVEACALATTQPLLPDLLATWVSVHGARVRTEKLRALAEQEVASHFWLAVLARLAADRGYRKWLVVERAFLTRAQASQPRLLAELSDVVGVEEWLLGSDLKVPAGSLRVRDEDVLSPRELAAVNHQYRLRLLYGADVRADIAYALQCGKQNTGEIARFVYCSREAAGRISAEMLLADEAGSLRS